MQYIPPNMKTNMRLHHSIQHDEMECRHLGLSTFWCVDVLTCRRCGLSTFWSVDVLVCRCFGLSTFWFVNVLVCRRFGLSTFRSDDVSVCRRFGLSTFWLSTFRFVDVLTSYRYMDSIHIRAIVRRLDVYCDGSLTLWTHPPCTYNITTAKFTLHSTLHWPVFFYLSY